MSFKRSFSQRSGCTKSPAKKPRNFDVNNYFHQTLQKSGLTLKQYPDKCKTSQETIQVIRNIKKNLESHYEYPANVSEFYSDFEKECEDLELFKHYLFPNIIRVAEDSLDEHVVNDSVIKILLSVPILQNKLIDYIFEKATDLTEQNKCGPWIKMILKCFSTLDSIVDREKISSNLIQLLNHTSDHMMRLEIITALPDVIGDQEHNEIPLKLSEVLRKDHSLTPAILECLSSFCLSDQQYEVLQKETLNILLNLKECTYFPNFVKFLLIPNHINDNTCLEAVQGLRKALNWSKAAVSPQEVASSKLLTAIAIRNSMVSSKVITNAWLKVISNSKESNDHRPIDIVILLILFSTSEDKQKQVENFIRKQIKADILKEDLLVEVFDQFKPILTANLKNFIELASSLLKSKTEPVVESFASYMYTLMISQLKDSSTTIVAELLQLCLDSKQCVMSVLQILNTIASKDMSILKPQSVQMLTLLDLMDIPLIEVRAVMNLLCGLAYTYKNSVIRDDIPMIIRKQLISTNLKIKIQGILAGIHAVKYLMASDLENNNTNAPPDDVSYSSVDHLPEGDLREAAQIIEMLSRSTKQFPDMMAFFYDELSTIIAGASVINKNFLLWLTDVVTNDLQQTFIVDALESERVGELKLCMQYCLNTDSEVDEVIAINIAGLTLQPQSEVCVGILSPLFQLVATLQSKQNEGDLSKIDALLGCAIVMPKFDIDLIEDLDTGAISTILDCLVHCVNWFRELLNAFSTQDDIGLRGKLLQRLNQIDAIERIISEILHLNKISYKPPVSTFNINKYTGEHIEKKTLKVQNTKQKPQKKIAADDSHLPETNKSQATQSNSSKNKIGNLHNISLRPINLNLLHLLNLNITVNNISDTELTTKTLKFILLSVNNNLNSVLLSKIKKKTFLTKHENVAYDPKKAEECAKTVSEMLPKVINHMEIVETFIEKQITTCTQEDSGFIYTAEMMEYIFCLENIYKLLTIFFKWIGFRNNHNAMLKSSLRTVAKSDSATVSLKELLVAVVERFEKHENYCLQLSTAVSLIELVKAIQTYSDSKQILKILRNLAQNFLSQEWKTPDGAHEKGLYYNQSVDQLASTYFVNNEILLLKNVSLQLTKDIQYLKTRNDTLNSLKCINKANFPILYRNLGTALFETTKNSLNKGMTNSEHLNLWRDVTAILKYMTDIAKSLENRNNLTALFKKSYPVLKLFISQGIPILGLQFKNDTHEVLEILKVLQHTTRFLQSLCCHSRLKKDTALMSKVPFMRQLLETLIYKVKAVLADNKCTEAFWMGNLKNKNLQGEVIASQQSVASDESAEDCDDQLPDDDCTDDSDNELLDPDSNSVSDIV